jgi:membrane protein DedA with SNARE-associated domain
VERHGYALLFFWVLAEQGAVPLPSIPLLLAAGALIRAGRMQFVLAVACCLAAVLSADVVWFQLGKRRGRRILRFICRVSLEPDSCVRQTENAFLKHGMRSLLFSKFIPGLNAVAAPLVGSSGAAFWRFLAWDVAGAVIWSTAYLTLGYVFAEQLETVVVYASRTGSGLLILVVGLFAIWLGWKFGQRRKFLKELDTARITPHELRDRLRAGEELFIVDLRGKLDEELSTIPGAVRISAEDLASRRQEIPRDREIILFCS